MLVRVNAYMQMFPVFAVPYLPSTCDPLTQATKDLSNVLAGWFERCAWQYRTRLAACFLRGCCHMGRWTSCDCENRFMFLKADAFASLIGKHRSLNQAYEATLLQADQLDRTRRAERLLDAGLDRSASHPHLPPELCQDLTGFAATALDKQCELAGIAHYQVPGADGAAPSLDVTPAYQWKSVGTTLISVKLDPTSQTPLIGIKMAWAVRRADPGPWKARMVALTTTGHARCTCPYYEFWGIPCRHVLFVFGRPQAKEWCEVVWWAAVGLGKADRELWKLYGPGQSRGLGPLVGHNPPHPAGEPSPATPCPQVWSKGTHLEAEFEPCTGLPTAGGGSTEAAQIEPRAPDRAASRCLNRSYSDRQTFTFEIGEALRAPLEAGHIDSVRALVATFCDELRSLVQPDSVSVGLGGLDRISIAGDIVGRRGSQNSSDSGRAYYDITRGTSNPSTHCSKRKDRGLSEDTSVPLAASRQRHKGVVSTRSELHGKAGPVTGMCANWDGNLGGSG